MTERELFVDLSEVTDTDLVMAVNETVSPNVVVRCAGCNRVVGEAASWRDRVLWLAISEQLEPVAQIRAKTRRPGDPRVRPTLTAIPEFAGATVAARCPDDGVRRRDRRDLSKAIEKSAKSGRPTTIRA